MWFIENGEWYIENGEMTMATILIYIYIEMIDNAEW
jgi:hypothetical protein